MRRITSSRKFLLGVGLVFMLVLCALALAPFISLEYLIEKRELFLQYYDRHPIAVVLLYVAVSSALIGAALPVAGIAALLAGALFGFFIGWGVSVVASTLGATIAFLWSRYLFRDWLGSRFHEQFVTINQGISGEGGYYLFSLRLMALFPFFIVNLLCGLTTIRLTTYIGVTFLGQGILLAVWIYAGLTVAQLESGATSLSWQVFAILGLVGLAPLTVHRLLRWFRSRHTTIN